jgi:hypothetical protein
MLTTMMRMLPVVLLASSALAACKDDGCSDELKIALELYINVPEGLSITRVTAELEREETCGAFRPDKTTDDLVYTCYEQGGGSYVVRAYSGDQEVMNETVPVTADECHAERATAYLVVDAP